MAAGIAPAGDGDGDGDDGRLLRRRTSALGFPASVLSALQAAVAGSGGTTSSQASQAVLLAAAPRPTTAADMMAGRPMDSRVVAVGVLDVDAAGGAGAAAPPGALALTAPISVTIPLRDPSIVTEWDASAPPAQQAARVNIGQGAFARQCTTSPAQSAPRARRAASWRAWQ